MTTTPPTPPNREEGREEGRKGWVIKVPSKSLKIEYVIV